MSLKKEYARSTLLLWLGILLLMAMALLIRPVHAQEGTPPPDAGCRTCHENLYYLYDTGKWFCQCETQMTCTCCHGGNPDALTEAEAHLGMVLYPTRNDATTCQHCHPDDFGARVERFVEIAGVSQIHNSLPTSAISPAFSSESDDGVVPESRIRSLEPWQLAGLTILGLALIVLVVVGVHYWKADRLASKNR